MPLLVAAVLLPACTSGGDDDSEPPVTNADVGSAPPDADSSLTPVADPAVREALPPTAEIAPVLRMPGGAAEVAAGDVVTLDAAVFAAQPIVRLELWSGSELVGTVAVDEPAGELLTGLAWQPQEAGLHALALRAFDADGGVATSFPLWVRAVEVDTTGLFAGAVPQGFRSVLDGGRAPATPTAPGPPALDVNTDTCVAGLELPAVQGAAGQAVFAAAFGSGGFVPLAVVPATGGVTELSIGSAPMMIYTAAFDSTTLDPGPPMVIVPPNPCLRRGWSEGLQLNAGRLEGLAGVERAYLYVSTDGGEQWGRAPLADQTFVYPDATGAFDFDAHLPAGAASLEFEAWGWTGNKLAPLGSGSWSPPPPSASATDGPGPLVVSSSPGGAFAGSDLDWMTIAPSREGTLCLFGPVPGQIGLPESQCSNWLSMSSYSRQFTWKMPGTPSHGVVQVSVVPPPATAATAFPGLVYSQSVAAPTDGASTFEVPLHDIFEPPASAKEQAPSGYQQLVDLATLGAALGVASEPSPATSVPVLTLAASHDVYWVRVVPMQGTAPLPFPSNPIVINLVREKPPGFTGTGTPEITVSMVPPRLPNEAYRRCVRVVSNPFGASNPAPHETPQWNADHADLIASMPTYQFEMGLGTGPSKTAQEQQYHMFEPHAFIHVNGVKQYGVGLVPGATVCAYHPQPPSKGLVDYVVDALEFVAGAWDFVAATWDKAKAFVVKIIVEFQCKPYMAIHQVPEETANDVCNAVTKVAVDAVLVAFGVPPTLPTFKQLIENGKEEFAAWVAEQAAKTVLGDKCGVLTEECKGVVEDMVKKLLDETQAHLTSALAQQSSTDGWILRLHPGIEVVAEPAGIVSPATFQIAVTRPVGEPPLSKACAMEGRATGHKPFYSWVHFNEGGKSGPVTGDVMLPKMRTFDLSGLGEGETRHLTLVLPTLATWYPSGQGPGVTQLQSFHKSQTTVFFQPDATITTTLATNCFPTGAWTEIATQPHQYDGSSEPWKIPL